MRMKKRSGRFDQQTTLSPALPSIEHLVLNNSSEDKQTECLYTGLSNSKPGHTTGRSRRSARRRGQAGSGKIGRPTK